jgi:hypothetical protein
MNIFVYGPLMFPEVMQAVVGRNFSFREGEVRGYVRVGVRDESQAAMIPFPDTLTQGIVYVEVDQAALKRMDTFFGKLFERVEVNIETDSGDWIEAETHVFKVSKRKLLTAKPWDENEFREKHLAKFMQSAVP